MSMSEKKRITLVKRKISITELAIHLDTSQSNLSNKLKRDNFSEKELNQIADILNCDFKPELFTVVQAHIKSAVVTIAATPDPLLCYRIA